MSLPTLFLVGVTHRTAPFGFREKLLLGTEMEATLATELMRLPSLREFAVLNTCNRTEIYGVADAIAASRQVSAAFCALRNVDPIDFDRFGFELSGRETVEHLLQVASGLDSQILGYRMASWPDANQTRNAAGPRWVGRLGIFRCYPKSHGKMMATKLQTFVQVQPVRILSLISGIEM
jgi:hypothetical protein